MSNENNQRGYSGKPGFFRSGVEYVVDAVLVPSDFVSSLRQPPVTANEASGTSTVGIVTIIPPWLSEEARLKAEVKEKDTQNKEFQGRLEKVEWKLKQRDRELEEDGIDLAKNFKTIEFLMDDSKRQVGGRSSSSAD